MILSWILKNFVVVSRLCTELDADVDAEVLLALVLLEPAPAPARGDADVRAVLRLEELHSLLLLLLLFCRLLGDDVGDDRTLWLCD